MSTLSTEEHSLEPKGDFGFGMIGGMLGGACFGILMQLTGMMTRYAEILGGTKDIDGWFVHIVVSAFLGAIFGAAAYQISKSWIVSGLAYGFIWWVVGSLFVLPVLMGNSIFTFDSFAWWGLLGNLIFGIVTAGVFSLMSRRYGNLVTQYHSA